METEDTQKSSSWLVDLLWCKSSFKSQQEEEIFESSLTNTRFFVFFGTFLNAT